MMEIASVVAQEVGMPINLALLIQAGLPIVPLTVAPRR